VEPGSASKSYGIEVARLAGLPRAVIERAREVLRKHEQSEHELSERLSPDADTVSSAAFDIVSDNANLAPGDPTGFMGPSAQRAEGSPVSSAVAAHFRRQEMLFTPIDREVLEKLRATDLDQLTPLEALTLLSALKKQIS